MSVWLKTSNRQHLWAYLCGKPSPHQTSRFPLCNIQLTPMDGPLQVWHPAPEIFFLLLGTFQMKSFVCINFQSKKAWNASPNSLCISPTISMLLTESSEESCQGRDMCHCLYESHKSRLLFPNETFIAASIIQECCERKGRPENENWTPKKKQCVGDRRQLCQPFWNSAKKWS